MSMKEKMHTGELYLPNGEEIMNEQYKDWRGYMILMRHVL